MDKYLKPPFAKLHLDFVELFQIANCKFAYFAAEKSEKIEHYLGGGGAILKAHSQIRNCLKAAKTVP